MRQIDDYVEAMFAVLPKDKEVEETKQRILEHMYEKFEAMQAEGMNENEALGAVISEFGSIDEMKHTFGLSETTLENPSDFSHDALEQLLQQYEAFIPKQRKAIAISVVLFIMSPFVTSFFDDPIVMFGMIAAGVGLLIYYIGRKHDFQKLIQERKNLLR